MRSRCRTELIVYIEREVDGKPDVSQIFSKEQHVSDPVGSVASVDNSPPEGTT